MSDKLKSEELIKAWVMLSGMIKNSRITKGLVYNEAIVMMLLYEKYKLDNIGKISIKEITQKTNMLKSLVNRTVNSLCKKGFLKRCESDGDKRMVFVQCVKEKLSTFIEVHEGSLNIANKIMSIIGKENTDSFIDLVNKLENANYCLQG